MKRGSDRYDDPVKSRCADALISYIVRVKGDMDRKCLNSQCLKTEVWWVDEWWSSVSLKKNGIHIYLYMPVYDILVGSWQ